MKLFMMRINKQKPELGALVVNSPDNGYLHGVIMGFTNIYSGFGFDQWEVRLLSPTMKIESIRIYINKQAV